MLNEFGILSYFSLINFYLNNLLKFKRVYNNNKIDNNIMNNLNNSTTIMDPDSMVTPFMTSQQSFKETENEAVDN